MRLRCHTIHLTQALLVPQPVYAKPKQLRFYERKVYLKFYDSEDCVNHMSDDTWDSLVVNRSHSAHRGVNSTDTLDLSHGPNGDITNHSISRLGFAHFLVFPRTRKPETGGPEPGNPSFGFRFSIAYSKTKNHLKFLLRNILIYMSHFEIMQHKNLSSRNKVCLRV